MRMQSLPLHTHYPDSMVTTSYRAMDLEMNRSTHDQEVFSFYCDDWPCSDFNGIVRRYRELVPHMQFAVSFLAHDTVKKFVDPFRHIQFVDFTTIMSINMPQQEKETEFALQALIEIPSQCSGAIGQGILGS